MSSYYCHHCGDQVPTGVEHLCKVVARKRIADLEQEIERLRERHRMQGELLHADVAFWGSDWKGDEWVGIKFCLVMNDIWAWGTADAEPVNDEELSKIYKIWKEYGEDGLVAWASLKLDLMPQQPWLEKCPKFHEIKAALTELVDDS